MDISKERIKEIIQEELNYSRTSQESDASTNIRVQRHLGRIEDLVKHLLPLFEEDDERVPEYIQEKIPVVAAILQSILDYKGREEVRSK
tara:strand:- start:543 stop:809 length:267 start_codon:yes stop_codon:yes gene_type:complete